MGTKNRLKESRINQNIILYFNNKFNKKRDIESYFFYKNRNERIRCIWDFSSLALGSDFDSHNNYSKKDIKK